jgi:hypothetical protein
VSVEFARAEIYTADELVPIPAQCRGPRRHSMTGIDAIKAPSLRGVRCFYCGHPLRLHPDFPAVIDAETRRKLRRDETPVQLTLEETP